VRTVYSSALGVNVSVLGFGCASLGSRISADRGRRALDLAFERGVTWYDVAPPYGDGEAEDVLGQFLRGRRTKVTVCTKFGIGRPNISPIQRAIRPIARRLLEMAPEIRPLMSSARSTGVRGPIDPNAIEPSVTESLRRLRTDYIDVLAMHEPSVPEVADEAIFEVLNRLREKGLVRSLSVAGSPDSIKDAILSSRAIAFAQLADSLFGESIENIRSFVAPNRLPFLVTHSVFNSGTIEQIERMPALKKATADFFTSNGLIDADMSSAGIILACAFSHNADGVVIASMFSREHIDRNCTVAAAPALPGLADYMRSVLLTSKTRCG
jgi:aryl-alcohol dehydrogenase-like predicted oxidoreductase